MELIICDQDDQESHWMADYIYSHYKKNHTDIQIRTCTDWPELYHLIREKKADIFIIAQDGVKGLDIVTGLNIAEGKIIWFSDLDFGVQAYRLGIAYFNKRPISIEKLVHALECISS